MRATAACWWTAHDGGVHRDGPLKVFLGIRLGDQGGEDPIPGTVGRLHTQAVVDAFLLQSQFAIAAGQRRVMSVLGWVARRGRGVRDLECGGGSGSGGRWLGAVVASVTSSQRGQRAGWMLAGNGQPP
jgi:hypothetical protein